MLNKVKRDIWAGVVLRVQNTAGHEVAEGIKGNADYIEDRIDGEPVARAEYEGTEIRGRHGVQTTYYVADEYLG